MNQTKQERYLELVAKFKDHVFNDTNLINPHILTGFNFDVINPWELWHNNLDAEVMFIGQDFSDIDSLKYNLENDWAKERRGSTNKALTTLFNVLGYEFTGVEFTGKTKYSLFFTNAILGIKKGNMSSSVKDAWWQETKAYVNELIDIVEPLYIIAMGMTAYKLICNLYDIPTVNKLSSIIGENIILPDNKILFVVQHCSPNGRISRNESTQTYDWIKISNTINP